MTTPLREANGLLFIGDPHLTTLRPGRRRDEDFMSSVLTKIEEAVAIANRHRLVPVFLGDMFDQHEVEQRAITRLIRILAHAWTWSLSNTGNHDMKHTKPSDEDSLNLLSTAGVLAVAAASGPMEEFLLGPERRRVGLGMTPYGEPIPSDVRTAFPQADETIWITHHDLLFKDAYPLSAPLTEMLGCGLAVNGHIHIEKPIERRGGTSWFNPGNITRMSVDVIDHVPAVWSWQPTEGLTKFELPDPPDLFDLTGRHVSAAAPAETIRTAREEASAFVELLRKEATLELDKSDDGSLLREEIEAKCSADNVSPAVHAIVLSLLQEAVARSHA